MASYFMSGVIKQGPFFFGTTCDSYSSELSQECGVVFHTYSPSEINAIQRVNTCSTFYIWHMWNCITLNFVTRNI